MKRRLRNSRRGHDDLLQEINVTPFVDILLVLLVVFIITAPLLTYSLKIELPTGDATQVSLDSIESPFLVEVDQQQQIVFEQKSYALEALQRHLASLPQVQKARPVYLQLDRSVPHGFLINLMLAFKNTGFQQVGLVFLDEPQ